MFEKRDSVGERLQGADRIRGEQEEQKGVNFFSSFCQGGVPGQVQGDTEDIGRCN